MILYTQYELWRNVQRKVTVTCDGQSLLIVIYMKRAGKEEINPIWEQQDELDIIIRDNSNDFVNIWFCAWKVNIIYCNYKIAHHNI